MSIQQSHASAIAIVLLLSLSLGGVLILIFNEHPELDIAAQDPALAHYGNTTDPLEDFNSTAYPQLFSRQTPFGNTQGYNWAKDKGRKYICKLDGAEVPAAEHTKFKGYHDLADWGWTRSVTEDRLTKQALGTINDMLKKKGLATEGPAIKDITWEHNRQSMVNGKLRLPTKGSYRNIYNPSQGVLIAIRSDIVFLELANQATPQQLKNLRYIVRFNVVDTPAPDPNPLHITPTNDVLLEALKKSNAPSDIPIKWPGCTFTQTDVASQSSNNAFDAMMGTPHLTAVAWFLLQHREALGKKTVGSITAWSADKSEGFLSSWRGKACLLIELVDVKEK